jgi:hypothetical protein
VLLGSRSRLETSRKLEYMTRIRGDDGVAVIVCSVLQSDEFGSHTAVSGGMDIQATPWVTSLSRPQASRRCKCLTTSLSVSPDLFSLAQGPTNIPG